MYCLVKNCSINITKSNPYFFILLQFFNNITVVKLLESDSFAIINLTLNIHQSIQAGQWLSP